MMNEMSRVFVLLIICIGVLVMCSSGANSALPSYDGLLTTETLPTGIVGNGFWVTTGPTQINWSVAQLANGSWSYDYNFSVPGGDISHFILECSPDLKVSDLFDLSGDFDSITIDTFTPPSPSNPNLPGTIHGIKFNNVSTTEGGFTFHTFRQPVWGNFYSKDGNAFNNPPTVVNSAWNAGFLLPHPLDPPADGSITNHLLVPDTSTAPIPDASTFVLACFGALPFFAIRKKLLR